MNEIDREKNRHTDTQKDRHGQRERANKIMAYRKQEEEKERYRQTNRQSKKEKEKER